MKTPKGWESVYGNNTLPISSPSYRVGPYTFWIKTNELASSLRIIHEKEGRQYSTEDIYFSDLELGGEETLREGLRIVRKEEWREEIIAKVLEVYPRELDKRTSGMKLVRTFHSKFKPLRFSLEEWLAIKAELPLYSLQYRRTGEVEVSWTSGYGVCVEVCCLWKEKGGYHLFESSGAGRYPLSSSNNLTELIAEWKPLRGLAY